MGLPGHQRDFRDHHSRSTSSALSDYCVYRRGTTVDDHDIFGFDGRDQGYAHASPGVDHEESGALLRALEATAWSEASHDVASNTSLTTYCPHGCPFTSIDVSSCAPPTRLNGWHSNQVEDHSTMSTSPRLRYSPKRSIGEIGHDQDWTGKRARNREELVQSGSFPSTMRSDCVEVNSGWESYADLTSAQYSTISLNHVLDSPETHRFDIDSHSMAAYSLVNPKEHLKHSSSVFWRPEAASIIGPDGCTYNTGATSAGYLDCLTSTSMMMGHEFPHREATTPALTPSESVTSISPEPSTVLVGSNDDTANLLSGIFPLLPPHLDPSDTFSHRVPVQPNDLYNPIYVRNDGTKNREGWCGYCQRWLQLRESSYNYDKKYSHGICPNTGRPFDVPVEIRRTFGAGAGGGAGRRAAAGKLHKNAGYYEGRCGECDRWIRLVGRSGPANSWWRHAFQCHSYAKAA